jgi:hypothetical protein
MNPGTSEESMINNVVWREALLRIGCDNLLHKLTRIEGDFTVRWEFVLIIADTTEKGTGSGHKHQ